MREEDAVRNLEEGLDPVDPAAWQRRDALSICRQLHILFASIASAVLSVGGEAQGGADDWNLLR